MGAERVLGGGRRTDENDVVSCHLLSLARGEIGTLIPKHGPLGGCSRTHAWIASGSFCEIGWSLRCCVEAPLYEVVVPQYTFY